MIYDVQILGPLFEELDIALDNKPLPQTKEAFFHLLTETHKNLLMKNESYRSSMTKSQRYCVACGEFLYDD